MKEKIRFNIKGIVITNPNIDLLQSSKRNNLYKLCVKKAIG